VKIKVGESGDGMNATTAPVGSIEASTVMYVTKDDYDHLLAQAMLLREALQELMPLRYRVKTRAGKTKAVGDIVRDACERFDGPMEKK
jgi:hypothetical protein